MGVVTAVQQKGGLVPQQLEAARPAYGLKAGADGALRDVPAMGTHHPQRRDGQRGVARLIAADERQAHTVQPVEVELHRIEVSTIVLQFVEIHLRQGGMLLSTDAADHGVRFRHAAVAHHRAALFDDARLRGGNVRDGGAQLLHMVHAQRRDDRARRRVNDIGGVQRAAEAHFQHHDIALLLGKIEHAQRRDDLELGGHILHGVGGRLHLLHQPHQRVIRNLLSVHLNALVEAVDEGRGVQAHPIARCLQAGRHHGGGAALAVGARDVHEFQLLVRVAQGGQQGAGAGQTGLMAGPLNGMDVLQGLFVVHRYCLFLRSRFRMPSVSLWAYSAEILFL